MVDVCFPVCISVPEAAVPRAMAIPISAVFVEVTAGAVIVTVVEVVEFVIVVLVTAFGSSVVVDSTVVVSSARVLVVYEIASSVTTIAVNGDVVDEDVGLGGLGPVRS